MPVVAAAWIAWAMSLSACSGGSAAPSMATDFHRRVGTGFRILAVDAP
jgi:hypothetical protein